MTDIAGTVVYRTTVTVVAASSGNGDTIAAMFNGVTVAGVSTTAAATAANASGTVTIYWPQTDVRAGNSTVLDIVSGMIAADTALTSPITATAATTAAMTS